MKISCEICHIIKSDSNDVIIDQSFGWRVVLMENQGVLGAVYITAVDHYQTLGDLGDEQWLGLRNLVRELEAAISQTFHPVYFNFACDMNDAAREGKPTHVHFKLRPRYSTAVKLGNEVFADPGFGTKKIEPHNVDSDTLRLIRDRIMRRFDQNKIKIMR